MSNLAIQILGLSKRYQIGIRERYPTLREALIRAASASLRAARSWASGRNHDPGPGWIWALRDVDLEVNHGEILGVIGRNGAGKSTLLKVLTGITEPTNGYADIYGRVGSLLEVGTGFHMELTGRENVFMNGMLLGMNRREIRRKFDEIVAFSGVEEFLDTPVKRYSSGMFMRLAFSVAAHLDPEILLVDEVLAVGDAAFQKKCLGKMGDVAGEGRTVLFVSHNMSAIQTICQKTVWFDGGRVKEYGPTPEVVHRYLESAVSRGSVPLTDRTDRKGDGSVRLRSIRIESDEQPTVISTTSRLRIAIEYASDRPLRHPRFLVTLSDQYGAGIYILDTSCTNELPDILPSNGTVICETEPINLSRGRCCVDLAVYNGGLIADRVNDVTQFEIVAEHFYPSGYMPGRDRVVCVIRHKWSIAIEKD
jgi:lipopolysaccharide transport system ATP-binding protein